MLAAASAAAIAAVVLPTCVAPRRSGGAAASSVAVAATRPRDGRARVRGSRALCSRDQRARRRIEVLVTCEALDDAGDETTRSHDAGRSIPGA